MFAKISFPFFLRFLCPNLSQKMGYNSHVSFDFLSFYALHTRFCGHVPISFILKSRTNRKARSVLTAFWHPKVTLIFGGTGRQSYIWLGSSLPGTVWESDELLTLTRFIRLRYTSKIKKTNHHVSLYVSNQEDGSSDFVIRLKSG